MLQHLNFTNKTAQNSAVNFAVNFSDLWSGFVLAREICDKYAKEALIILPNAIYTVSRKKIA